MLGSLFDALSSVSVNIPFVSPAHDLDHSSSFSSFLPLALGLFQYLRLCLARLWFGFARSSSPFGFLLSAHTTLVTSIYAAFLPFSSRHALTSIFVKVYFYSDNPHH